uniref:Aspartate beta-hydroxylase n=1 Tax=Prolemur simus TaxID=1328070 RepID=A0A8C9ANL0_PROSS
MAPRKNAKGGGGGNSSSSGSGSGSTSAGSSGGSSSPGARRETKHKNGKKGGLSGSSFFTWFMVIALLGVWTSVAVVWFDLVDYEEVLGKLGIYDADGDGDFDVDDAKVLLGLKERSASEPTVAPEEAEPYADPEEAPMRAEPRYIEDEVTEQIQPLLHDMVYTEHETVDSYHGEETVSQDYNQDMEEMMYEQENPDSSEPVIDDERLHHDADSVTYQDYDEQVVYEPSENETIEISDNAVEDSNIISEEVSVPPVEEHQEVPPDT